MLRAIRERPAAILLVAILFGLLVLMSVQVTGREGTTALERGLFGVTAPVARLFSGSVGGARSIWQDYVDLRAAQEENRALRAELRRLETERSRFESVRQENRRLRELLDLRERIPYTAIPARVLSNESLGPQGTLVIDRGARDAVAANQPVVAPGGIVGRVLVADAATAKVQLITNAAAGTAVVLVRTRLQGLAEGRGGRSLRLRWIPQFEDVRPGDLLVTSGLDRIYPAGFPVGEVSRIGEGAGVMKEIQIVPAVDSARLEEVLVLHFEEEPPLGPPDGVR